jgi:hypothetical protein
MSFTLNMVIKSWLGKGRNWPSIKKCSKKVKIRKLEEEEIDPLALVKKKKKHT